MKSEFLALSILTIGVFELQALANPILHDIAVDAVSGDNLIVQVTDNPNGKVVVLNDRDDRAYQELRLGSSGFKDARFEIELIRVQDQEVLTYLVQEKSGWVISGFYKSGDQWVAFGQKSSVSGFGTASKLTQVAQDKVAVVLGSASSERAAKMVIVQLPTDKNENYHVIGSADYSEVKKLASAAASAAVANKDESQDPSRKQAVALIAGWESGIGIAYRRFLTQKLGIQVGGVPLPLPRDKSGSVSANLGSLLLYTLNQSQKNRLMLSVGLGAFYSREKRWIAPTDPMGGNGTEDWVSETNLNFGLGLGYEVGFLNNLGFLLDWSPLTYTYKVTSMKGEGGYQGSPQFHLNAAFLYYF